MFENYRVFETTYAGRPLIVETGKTCGLSNGSCWVRYGETVVMANVTASVKPREGIDFFPLSVDYTPSAKSQARSQSAKASPAKRLSSLPAALTDLSVPFSPRICATTFPLL